MRAWICAKKKFKFGASALLLALVLSGCASVSRTDFPVESSEQMDLAAQNVSIFQLSPENISTLGSTRRNRRQSAALPGSEASWRYLVGVGDVLSITVWDHPELTLPAGPERSQIESGSWVRADGSFFYPYIGNVIAVGRTVGDIQADLAQRLAEFIPDPQVEVTVAAFNSQKVLITGAVARPGSQGITNLPRSLIEAVNEAGGLLNSANSQQVSIQRNGKTYYVNLHAFLSSGRANNNPTLRGGDIVNVPILERDVAFVLGQITLPGSVELPIDGVSLTDAIATQGGLREETADAQGIFVFRGKAGSDGIDVFQLDATTPLAFVVGSKFMLRANDVVYVVADPAAQWNAVIAALLPSISAVRGVQTISGDL